MDLRQDEVANWYHAFNTAFHMNINRMIFFYRFAFGLTKKTLHDSPRDIFSLFSFHFILSFFHFFLRLFFSFVHHVHRSERLNFMHTIYAKMTKKMRTIAVKKIDRCWARARKPFSICNCQWNSFSDGIRNV